MEVSSSAYLPESGPAYLKLSLTPFGSMEMKVLWNKLTQYLGFYRLLLMLTVKFPFTLARSISLILCVTMPNINVNVSIATPCPQLFLKPLS